jgi:uncharacterized SAM-binding protein YcdF (DUF218 family)
MDDPGVGDPGGAATTRAFTRPAADSTRTLRRDDHGAPGPDAYADPDPSIGSGGGPDRYADPGPSVDPYGDRDPDPYADRDPGPYADRDPGPYADRDPDPDPYGGPRRPAGRRPRRRFRWGRFVALVVLVAIALPPGTWAWVWYTARLDDRPASDAIVVLGASQYNGVPSPIFEARLQHAADLYAEGVAPMIVTVGGNQPGDAYTEGGSGRDWLAASGGVPADAIVAIEQGSDTLESVEMVSAVFQQRGWSTAVIVTDPWHSLRSRVMAEDFAMEAATSPSRSGPAVLERRTQLWYITRETASLWYYWIFGDSSDIEVDAAS